MDNKFLFSKCVDAFPSLEFVDGKCPWLHCVEEVLPCGDVCLQCIDDKFPSKMIPLEGTVVTEAVKMTSKGKESAGVSFSSFLFDFVHCFQVVLCYPNCVNFFCFRTPHFFGFRTPPLL